jgi:pimeloyl-ACP methyl ester carboxylesterase
VLTSLLNGAVMAERHGGSVPKVVAMHGWGRDRRDWTEALSGLDALALDMPGFGLSPQPPEAWGAAGYAEQLRPLLAEIGPVVLVGHSFGGRVATVLAATSPDVSAVVLTGVPLLRKEQVAKPSRQFQAMRWMNAHGMMSDARMEQARRKHGSADYRNADGVMRGVLVKVVQEEYADVLAGIRVPVVMVWGAQDTVVPVSIAARAQEFAPSARLVTVEGAGHLLDAPLSRQIHSELTSLMAADARG